MKEKKREEYLGRVRLILRTELNGRNKIEAVNLPLTKRSRERFN